MIKRLIFDLDNTLIMWKDEYLKAIKETVEQYKIKEDYKYISFLIDEYDNELKCYDKHLLIDFINSKINDKINIDFLNTFIDKFGYMSDKSNSVINVLDFLSKKYELVVLTNWFRKPQIERLKNASIYKYFKDIIGGEVYIKPNKNAFLNACGNYKPNECIMIGDDYQKDIIGAYKAGLNVIFYNYNHKNNPNGYKEIKSLDELRDINEFK